MKQQKGFTCPNYVQNKREVKTYFVVNYIPIPGNELSEAGVSFN